MGNKKPFFNNFIFNALSPTSHIINTDSSRYQISRGSKYMYIGNSYWAVHGSFDFFLSLYRMQFTFYGSRLALTHLEVNEIAINV